jgi:hypothetical protein
MYQYHRNAQRYHENDEIIEKHFSKNFLQLLAHLFGIRTVVSHNRYYGNNDFVLSR